MTTRFPTHTPESAVGKASDLLGGIIARVAPIVEFARRGDSQ